MKVGTIVKLKVACLGNDVRTLGVVFYNYGSGSQVIFKNGNYDGFDETEIREFGKDKSTEKDYFLEEIGFCTALAGYKFTNVIQLERDYQAAIFNVVFHSSKLINNI